MNLASFPVPNAGAALSLLHLAHTRHLRASWHPSGGDTHKRYVPVSHTVWVLGTSEAIRKLKEAVR